MAVDRVFPPKDSLSEAELRQGLRRVLRDAMASQAMASLTGSAFLVAFALKLGASNAVIGLLAAIPQLAQLVQLPAVYLVERVRNRRAVCVMASGLGRSAWLGVAAAPFLFDPAGTLSVLVFGLLAASAAAAIANCAWNSWIHDLVPTEQLGPFFGKRFALATGTGVAVSLAGAFFLDHVAWRWLPDPLDGYGVLFGLGFLLGLLGVRYVARIPEPRMPPPGGSSLRAMLAPLRDDNFRNLIRFQGAWNFALYLAAPFFSVYMLKRLGLSLAWVVGLIALGRVVNIVFLRVWGEVSSRLSNKSVLAVSGPLCLLCFLGWTFTTLPEPHPFTLPLLVVLHALMGVAMAGITLATGNISLKLAPRGQGTSYLAATNFVSALAAGLAPLCSGHLADFFVDRELSWTLRWTGPGRDYVFQTMNLRQWDFLFVLSFVAGLYALHRLAFVQEVGEVEEKVVLHELVSAIGRELRDFSTVSGFRNIVSMTGWRGDGGGERKGGAGTGSGQAGRGERATDS